MATTKLSSKKKMRNTLFICFLILLCLIGRIGIIQFVQGEELSSLAYQQHTLDRKINPKRGTILDSTGKKILAVSSTVETVTINPGNIAKENKEKVAKKLSELFDMDYEKVLKKVTKRSSIETISKKVEKGIINWLNQLDDEKREQFTNNLFSILKKADIHDLNEIRQAKLSSMIKILKETKNMDKETRMMIISYLKDLYSEIKE